MKREEIIAKFKERINDGKSIRYTDIKKDDSKLLYAMEKIGGVTACAEALGISKQELVDKYGLGRVILNSLTEKEILDRLNYLKSIGKLTTNAMRTEFKDLRLENALKKRHGSVKKALEYYNLEKDTIVIDKDSLIDEIRMLQSKSVDLSYTNMKMNYSKLVANVNKKFDMGWNTFLEYMEIEFTPLGREKSIEQGLKFEKVFKEVLEALNITYIHNKEAEPYIRPDFQLEDKNWIDCKLSSWTSSIPSTINKYIEKCNTLTIVFLRGKEKHLENLKQDRVVFRKIDYYYPYLEEINRHDLIEKLENILTDEF